MKPANDNKPGMLTSPHFWDGVRLGLTQALAVFGFGVLCGVFRGLW